MNSSDESEDGVCCQKKIRFQADPRRSSKSRISWSLRHHEVQDGSAEEKTGNRDGRVKEALFKAALGAEDVAFAAKSRAKARAALLKQNSRRQENRQDDHGDGDNGLPHIGLTLAPDGHFVNRDTMGPMSVWKTLGLLLGVLILVGSLLFARQTYTYYQAIRSGELNPLLDQQLESSVSHLIANKSVSQADLDLLADPTAPSIGSASPTLTIVEFLDFGCPFCRQAFEPVRERVLAHQENVKLIVRHFPLEDLHPGATHASYAAHCAQEQGKFWPYHDKLYLNQMSFTDNDLIRFAREVGLDLPAFNACMTAPRTKQVVEHDQAVGLSAGVEGTPTFFFNGVKIQGAPSREALEYLINRFLNGK